MPPRKERKKTISGGGDGRSEYQREQDRMGWWRDHAEKANARSLKWQMTQNDLETYLEGCPLGHVNHVNWSFVLERVKAGKIEGMDQIVVEVAKVHLAKEKENAKKKV